MKKSAKLQCNFYLSMAPEKETFVQKKLKNCKVVCSSKALTFNTSDPRTDILGIFVDSKITEKIFDALPHLKLIMLLSTGYDNVDLDIAKKRGVAVCNVPAYGEVTVAEHALTLLLALLKNIPASLESVKKGRFNCQGLRGMDLQGKTIGVIGTGKIGINFIRLVSAFGVKVLAYDAYPKEALAKEFRFEYVPLKRLLKESHVVSVHVPLLKETYHLFNAQTFSQMKKGTFLINTSRGAVVDSVALVQALKKGHVQGAGLDVLDGEEYLKSSANIVPGHKREAAILCKANEFLMNQKNVLITPHNAFNTEEALQRIFDVGTDIIIDFSQGRELKNRIV